MADHRECVMTIVHPGDAYGLLESVVMDGLDTHMRFSGAGHYVATYVESQRAMQLQDFEAAVELIGTSNLSRSRMPEARRYDA